MVYHFFPELRLPKSIEDDVWGWVRLRPMMPEILRPEERQDCHDQQEMTFPLLWLWLQGPSLRASEVGLGEGRVEKENLFTGSPVLGATLLIERVSNAQSDRQLGAKRLLPPHSCHYSLFIPASSETAFNSILIDGIFCSVSSGRRGRRIYLLHRQFLWFLTRLLHPLQTCTTQYTHWLVTTRLPWPLGFLSLWLHFSIPCISPRQK